MSRYMEQIEARKRELAVGRGGRLWSRPVPLEPPFILYDPLKPANGKSQVPRGWPAAEIPDSLQTLRVRPSDDDQYNPALAEQLLVSLNATYSVAFEVLGAGGEVYLNITAEDRDVGAVQGQVQAHYPGCEVFPAGDILQEVMGSLKHARGYRLRRSHLLQLREGHRAEPYAALVGFLGALQHQKAALFQVLFIPVRRDWYSNIMKVARDPYDPSKSAFTNLPQLPKRAEAKTGKPLFAVGLRLAASSKELLSRLEGSFLAQFQGEENSLVPMEEPYPLEPIFSRNTCSRGMLLNAGELAALVHIPDPDNVPEALAAAEPGAPAPSLATRDVLIPLGVNRHQGAEALSGISEEWLTRHVAIFGGTGYGKTNLMQYAFASILDQGYGMAILDPKGDLARGFLELVPEHRVDDVVWFDPTDREHPPALNVLQAGAGLEDETLTAELMVGLKRLFQGNAEFGPRMEWLLRNAIRTLLASEGEKTLYDIPRFLEDERFRQGVLATAQDRELREFWQRRNLSQTVIDPVLNRLSSFLDRPTIRHIVSQPNRIDFRQVMREGKIFIANLEKGVLQDAAYVLGSFILSRLQLAALARRPGERRLFPILVDEFHNFAGSGMDTESIETFLSEARSYRAPLVMATQYVGRLNRDVATALFGNVGTLLCLHLGQIDAQILQRELGEFSAEDLLDLEVGEAIARMGSARDAFNVRIPLAPQRESHREAIIARSRERYCRPLGKVNNHSTQEQETPPPQPQEPGAEIPPDEARFLEYVAQHPELTLSRVGVALGLGGGRTTRIRRSLEEQGFLLEVETTQGAGGRRANYGLVSLSGLKAAGIGGRTGRGGPAHRHYQALVRQTAETRGYQAAIEQPLPGGGALDVYLEKDGQSTAVEISVSTSIEGELRNVQQGLAAGCHRVLCFFADEQRIPQMARALEERLSREHLARVALAPVSSFRDHL